MGSLAVSIIQDFYKSDTFTDYGYSSRVASIFVQDCILINKKRCTSWKITVHIFQPIVLQQHKIEV